MRQERGETVADEPLPDELVAVAVRAERRRRVVDVQNAKALEPDLLVEVAEGGVERFLVGHVDPDAHQWHESMQTPRRMAADGVGERGKLVDRAPDRPAGACGVLDAQPEPVSRQLEELAHRGRDDGDRPVEAVAEVRAGVEHDRVGVDRARGVHRRPQRGERFRANLGVRAREVDEVERVAGDVADLACRRRARKRASCSSECSVGFHICGLCVNTWTQVPPISSTRSMAFEIPPAAETWAP